MVVTSGNRRRLRMANKGLTDALDLIARTIQCNHDIIMVLERRVTKIEKLLKGANWQESEGSYVLPDFADKAKETENEG